MLLLVFGGAALAGGAFGPDRDATAQPPVTAATPTQMLPTAASPPPERTPWPSTPPRSRPRDPALSAASRSPTTASRSRSQQTELPRGRATELRFRIVGADGQPVRDFEVEHEKRMHLIVVRRDGQGFQHLHPDARRRRHLARAR